jgi:chromosome segregation ATPase
MKIMCVLGWIACVAICVAYTSTSTSSRQKVARQIDANKAALEDKQLQIDARLDHIQNSINNSATKVSEGNATLKGFDQDLRTTRENRTKFDRLIKEYKAEMRKMKEEIDEYTKQSTEQAKAEENTAAQIPKIEKHIEMLKKAMPAVTLSKGD